MKCYDEVIELGGKQKLGRWECCSGRRLGGKLTDGGIQLGSSSWAKKMIILRTKVSGMWLFYNLFTCVVYTGLLGYYVLNWSL